MVGFVILALAFLFHSYNQILSNQISFLRLFMKCFQCLIFFTLSDITGRVFLAFHVNILYPYLSWLAQIQPLHHVYSMIQTLLLSFTRIHTNRLASAYSSDQSTHDTHTEHNYSFLTSHLSPGLKHFLRESDSCYLWPPVSLSHK